MSYKVIIELEYENKPKVENVLEYIKELGNDLDYKLINNSKKRYEVQTKFIYGFENVWRDEDGKLIYFNTREQAIKELRENVDDWNNDPNTTSKYYYNDYRVRRVNDTTR